MTKAVKETPAKDAALEVDVGLESSSKVDQALSDEIDGAVEVITTELAADRDAANAEETAKKDLPLEEASSGDNAKDKTEAVEEKTETTDVKPEAGDEDKKSAEVTDAHLERAIKAGMTMADAKSFSDVSALENVVSLLESRKDEGGTADDDSSGDDTQNTDDDPLAAIPDLDPEIYDENVVAGFKAMKEIVRAQQETITGLQKKGESSEGDWYAGQLASLDKSVSDALVADPAKKVALKEKFDVLTAGYHAGDKAVGRDDVFSEAVSMVLGSEVAAAASSVKSEILSKRSRQHISRPAGSVVAPSGDVFEDTAEELDRKFFGKK